MWEEWGDRDKDRDRYMYKKADRKSYKAIAREIEREQKAKLYSIWQWTMIAATIQ